jgi:hypothetical protein
MATGAARSEPRAIANEQATDDEWPDGCWKTDVDRTKGLRDQKRAKRKAKNKCDCHIARCSGVGNARCPRRKPADAGNPAKAKQHNRSCKPNQQAAHKAFNRHGVRKGRYHTALTGILR